MADSDLKLYTEPTVSETLINTIKWQKGNQKLDLTQCKLTRIPLDAIEAHFGEPIYKDLDLSFNCICYISPNFVNQMHHLIKLDLSRNEIRRLPENIGEMEHLVYLDLHHNQLQTLPLSMGNMIRLAYLNVTDNPLRGPLRYLGSKKSGLDMAQGIVSYLHEISLVANVSTTRSVNAGIINPQQSSSRAEFIPRSTSALHSHNETEGFGNGPAKLKSIMKINKTTMRRKGNDTEKPADESQTLTQILTKIVLVIGLWIFLLPIFIAFIADTPYLTHLAEISPTFDMIWTDYNYKQIHHSADTFVKIIPRNPWLLSVEGSSSELPVKKSGVLGYITRFLS